MMEGITTTSFAIAGSTVAEAERAQETELTRILDWAFRYAYAFLPGLGQRRQDAEEIAQEVALAAHRKFKGRLGDCSKAWVYRTARNKTLNLLRGAARSQKRDTAYHGAHACGGGAEQEERLREQELSNAVARLPGRLRDVVVLFYMDQNTIDDVAALLRIRAGTVKSRLDRARTLLREMLV